MANWSYQPSRFFVSKNGIHPSKKNHQIPHFLGDKVAHIYIYIYIYIYNITEYILESQIAASSSQLNVPLKEKSFAKFQGKFICRLVDMHASCTVLCLLAVHLLHYFNIDNIIIWPLFHHHSLYNLWLHSVMIKWTYIIYGFTQYQTKHILHTHSWRMKHTRAQ